MKKEPNTKSGSEFSGSPGRVRTYDTLINSQLRYHCATGEFLCAREHKKRVYRTDDLTQATI